MNEGQQGQAKSTIAKKGFPPDNRYTLWALPLKKSKIKRWVECNSGVLFICNKFSIFEYADYMKRNGHKLPEKI